MTATATSNYIGEAMRATAALAPPSLAYNPGAACIEPVCHNCGDVPWRHDGGQADAPPIAGALVRSSDRPRVDLPHHRLSGGLRGSEPEGAARVRLAMSLAERGRLAARYAATGAEQLAALKQAEAATAAIEVTAGT